MIINRRAALQRQYVSKINEQCPPGICLWLENAFWINTIAMSDEFAASTPFFPFYPLILSHFSADAVCFISLWNERGRSCISVSLCPVSPPPLLSRFSPSALSAWQLYLLFLPVSFPSLPLLRPVSRTSVSTPSCSPPAELSVTVGSLIGQRVRWFSNHAQSQQVGGEL